jgi:hypothetical protein
MFTFIFNTLKTLPTNFWYVLAGFLGVSSITTPIALSYLIVNSSAIVYKTGETEINLKGKELTSINEENIDKLQQQIEHQNQKILELTQAAKAKNLDTKLPELKEVQKAVVESEIRLNDVTTSNEELKDFVEEAIATPE